MKKGYNQYFKKYNKYYFTKDYVIGIANNTGEEFFIDYNDYEIICKYTWNQKNNTGYIYANHNNKRIYLHRLLFNLTEKNKYVDHINHNILDNRRKNLRVVSNSQNQMNRDKPKQNTSGIKGVYWHKNKEKWQANIQVDNKLLYLGIFDSKQDAIKARKAAEKKYFNEYNYYKNIGTCSNG